MHFGAVGLRVEDLHRAEAGVAEIQVVEKRVELSRGVAVRGCGPLQHGPVEARRTFG